MNKIACIYRLLTLRLGKKLENWSRMSEIHYTSEESVCAFSPLLVQNTLFRNHWHHDQPEKNHLNL